MVKKNKVIKVDEQCDCGTNCHCMKHNWHRQSSGAIYGLGFIGASIYYIATATSFLMGLVGVFKALVWPAFLVYHALKFLGM
jgi:hypothetical protein